MRVKNNRNKWTLFLLLLAGMVLGSFLGYLFQSNEILSWLDFGTNVGLTSPVTMSLGVISLTLGFVVKINVGSPIGMLLGYIAYRLTEG
jgi:F0F1-type ATP synthase assembly protein I